MNIDERVVASIVNAVLGRLDDVSSPAAEAGGGKVCGGCNCPNHPKGRILYQRKTIIA